MYLEYAAGPDTSRQGRQTLVLRPEIKTFIANDIKRANN